MSGGIEYDRPTARCVVRLFAIQRFSGSVVPAAAGIEFDVEAEAETSSSLGRRETVITNVARSVRSLRVRVLVAQE